MSLNLDRLQGTINHICCCEPDIETTVTTFCVENLILRSSFFPRMEFYNLEYEL